MFKFLFLFLVLSICSTNLRAEPINYEFGFTADATLQHTFTDTEFRFVFDGDTNEMIDPQFYGFLTGVGPLGTLEVAGQSVDIGEWDLGVYNGDMSLSPMSGNGGLGHDLFLGSLVDFDFQQTIDTRDDSYLSPSLSPNFTNSFYSSPLTSLSDFGLDFDFDISFEDDSINNMYFATERPAGNTNSAIRYEFGFTANATLQHTFTDTEFRFVFDGDTNEMIDPQFYGFLTGVGPLGTLEVAGQSVDIGEWDLGVYNGDMSLSPMSGNGGLGHDLFLGSLVDFDLQQTIDTRDGSYLSPSLSPNFTNSFYSSPMTSISDFGLGFDFDLSFEDDSVNNMYFASHKEQIKVPSPPTLLLFMVGILFLFRTQTHQQRSEIDISPSVRFS
ncbi:hypothetical protein L0668_09100 [Paraglaciecola aquimarina]|uniref:PEP-CTERM sorting domain-containing protein n=1 Tax=Paraglaciecola algarum TaxID=3050085 RepID=A0ABS9D5S4_9ALTE|nr:hypothetical protein [Paraglaciecola sp. G1-23]MCF2948260.1 hypothetical protein [Paraglaciecola sp. G1-23]